MNLPINSGPADTSTNPKASSKELEGLNPGDLFARAISAGPPGGHPAKHAPAGRKIPRLAVGIVSLAVIAAAAGRIWSTSGTACGTSRASCPPVIEIKTGRDTRSPGDKPLPAAPTTITAKAPDLPKPKPTPSPDPELDRLKSAAAQGDIAAQFQLGNRYRDGKGVKKDLATAVGWYRQAAEKGSVEADVELGLIYWSGKVMFQPVNWDRVVAVFKREAEEGNANSQLLLGSCYRCGLVVPRDPNKAVEWFQKSVDQGNLAAPYYLGEMYNGYRGLPLDEAKLFYWMEKSAKSGRWEGMLALAELYAKGTGTPKDPAKAYEWVHKVAEQGFVDAQAVLGGMYYKGYYVPKDIPSAIYWCRKAADKGNADAQKLLSRITSSENPTGGTNQSTPVSKSVVQQMNDLIKTAQSGIAAAQYEVGYVFLMNTWNHKELGPSGFDWVKKAAENGNPEAQSQLGDMYAAGMFVPRDEAKAAEWRAKAVRKKQNLPNVQPFDPKNPQFNNAE